LNSCLSSICDQIGRGKKTRTHPLDGPHPPPDAASGNPARIRALGPSIQTVVNPLRLLVDAFVNTFGITQPTPEAEARAGRYIALLLAAMLAVLGTAAWLLRAAFAH
jgi:hypothetical protein